MTVIVPRPALVSISTCAPSGPVKDAARRYAVPLRGILDRTTGVKGRADYGGQRGGLVKIKRP